MGVKNELVLTGYTNDLLTVNENDNVMITRLLDDDSNEDQSVSIELWSTDQTKKHKIFKQFMNKKIEMTIKIIE